MTTPINTDPMQMLKEYLASQKHDAMDDVMLAAQKQAQQWIHSASGSSITLSEVPIPEGPLTDGEIAEYILELFNHNSVWDLFFAKKYTQAYAGSDVALSLHFAEDKKDVPITTERFAWNLLRLQHNWIPTTGGSVASFVADYMKDPVNDTGARVFAMIDKIAISVKELRDWLFTEIKSYDPALIRGRHRATWQYQGSEKRYLGALGPNTTVLPYTLTIDTNSTVPIGNSSHISGTLLGSSAPLHGLQLTSDNTGPVQTATGLAGLVEKHANAPYAAVDPFKYALAGADVSK